jgi:hypothetical protein
LVWIVSVGVGTAAGADTPPQHQACSAGADAAPADPAQARAAVLRLDAALQKNPSDAYLALKLFDHYVVLDQLDHALDMLDLALREAIPLLDTRGTLTAGERLVQACTNAYSRAVGARPEWDFSDLAGLLMVAFCNVAGADSITLANRYAVIFHAGAFAIPDRPQSPDETSALTAATQVHFAQTTRYKLWHDIEQGGLLQQLLRADNTATGGISPAWQWIAKTQLPALRAAHARAERAGDGDDGGVFLWAKDEFALMARGFNRAWYVPLSPSLAGGAVRATVVAQAAELHAEYTQKGVLVIDNFLTDEALTGLRDFTAQATIFHSVKLGYVGAMFDTGFASPLLAQVASEMTQALPRLLGGLPLLSQWAFKYDEAPSSGVNIHADESAVNVNLWITEDDANLEPERGGLVIFTKPAPLDWDYAAYNGYTEGSEASRRIKQLLESTGYANVTVAHGSNRAVLFNGNLFHKTDGARFKPGYRKRRVNLTFLFGRRGQLVD